MRVTRVSLRDFRNYERAEAALGDGLTVVWGPNGAGKTNLLEAVYFGCTGRSCRTSNERELVRFGQGLARVTVEAAGVEGEHTLEVGFAPGEPKRFRFDGAPVERLLGLDERPPVGVFMPERLELVKGGPAMRRAHLDQLVAAIWPSRAGARAEYARALAQRNALIGRIRSGAGLPHLLDPWDLELARRGVELIAARRAAIERVRDGFLKLATALGLHGGCGLDYRPRSRAEEAGDLRGELLARRDEDLARGFTTHGPHRDDLALTLDGRPLRAYGSQGQQRIGVLALLLAERDLLAARGRPPLMLLDDVMSELDGSRRERLVELLRSAGQAVVTATEPEHVPGAGDPAVELLSVAGGTVRSALGVAS